MSVVINWSGIHQIERCPYEVKVDAGDVVEQTFVRLYNETEDNGRPRHVVVQPGSRIEFLAAEAHVKWKQGARAANLEFQPDDVWLKIRVDGKEGWIHAQEDFVAVGLPFSG